MSLFAIMQDPTIEVLTGILTLVMCIAIIVYFNLD